MNKAAKILLEGGVGVIPTDTLYGLVARAEDKKAVERIYRIKGRKPEKPLIILIPSTSDLDRFKVELNEKARGLLEKYWPGPVSIILPTGEKDEYLHRGTKTLAFRQPGKKDLVRLLKITGPLVAPSANPEGENPATNLKEIEAYFSGKVDFIVDGGTIIGSPSTLISISSGEPEILRGEIPEN